MSALVMVMLGVFMLSVYLSSRGPSSPRLNFSEPVERVAIAEGAEGSGHHHRPCVVMVGLRKGTLEIIAAIVVSKG
jgi:hypothetical protein